VDRDSDRHYSALATAAPKGLVLPLPSNRASTAALLLAAGIFPSLGWAEEQLLQSQRWQSPADGRGLARTSSGALLGHLDFDVGLWTGYERNPLTVEDRNAQRVAALTDPNPPWNRGAGPRTTSLIESRVGSELTASLGLFNWVQIFGTLPITVYQDRGGGISVVSSAISPLQTTNLGDLRLGAKIRVLRAADHLVDLSLIPQLTLPNGLGFRVVELHSGNRSVRLNPGVDGWAQGYTSEGFPTFQPELAISREWYGLFAGFNTGVRLRRPYALNQLNVGQELLARGGVGFKGARLARHLDVMRFFPVEAGVELSAATSLNTPYVAVPVLTPGITQLALKIPPPVQPHQPSVELSGYAGMDVQGVHPYLAAAVGLVAGYGTPDWRVVAGFRFATDAQRDFPPGPPDDDGDGTPDVVDWCPTLAGPKEFRGCPQADDDQDGILNVEDRCPYLAETINKIDDKDGCPEVPIPVITPEPPPPEEETTPAPAEDLDEDGVPDAEDACPEEAETLNEIDDEDGCPEVEVLTEETPAP